MESLEKEWTTDNGTLACTVKLAYPVFEGDTEGEKNINAFFKEWADDKLDYYENDKDSIVNIALQYQTELETEQNSTQEDSTLPPVPVSYTHLDVYKRQVEIGERQSGQEQEVEVNFDGSRCLILKSGDRLKVTRSDKTTSIMKLSELSFLERLHRKMSE